MIKDEKECKLGLWIPDNSPDELDAQEVAEPQSFCELLDSISEQKAGGRMPKKVPARKPIKKKVVKKTFSRQNTTGTAKSQDS